MAVIKEAEAFFKEIEIFLGGVVSAELDFSVRKDKYVLALSTSVVFLAIYLLTLAISYLSKTFHSLSSREKVFWCLSVCRALFGVLSACLGCLCWCDDKLHADPIHAATPVSNFSISVALGFFVFETVMLLGSNLVFRFFDPLLASHHFLALYLYLTTAHLNTFAAMVSLSLLLEMTTPLSCVCWILIKVKRAHTTLWKANQLALIHLFHCRSVIEFVAIYQVAVNIRGIWAVSHPIHFVIVSGSPVITGLWLTPFWLYKKTWQLFNPVDWNHASSTSTGRTVAANGEVHTLTSPESRQSNRIKID